MGKTSLYRQLVGKHYMPDLESTHGIDNTTVNTVDRRNVEIAKWEEKEDPATGEHFGQALAGELAGKFNNPVLKEKDPKPYSEKELLRYVQEIEAAIAREIERAKERERQRQSPPQLHRLPSIGQPVSNPAAAAIPSTQPPPSKRIRVEQPEPAPPPARPGPMEPRQPRPASPPPQRALTQPLTAPPQRQPTQPTSSATEDESTDTSSPAEQSTTTPASPAGILNRRQSSQLNQIAKGKPFQKKELPLVLNTLDFAGQKMYRPMHHCFISRRAVYIVVFKIPEILKLMEDTSSDPIGEVRYWVQSIHAHIYPPDPDLKTKDETINRVILVGTHRGVPEDEILCSELRKREIDIVPQCSQQDLKKIDDLIQSKLIHQSHCVKHIHPVKECGSPCNYFIPVENSIDKVIAKDKDYLEESGTKLLQDQIQQMSKSDYLHFLQEFHPLKWLKFEDRLKVEEQSKTRRKDNCLIMKIEDVKKLARNSGITNEDQLNLALKFFHDTGKIIYLSKF